MTGRQAEPLLSLPLSVLQGLSFLSIQNFCPTLHLLNLIKQFYVALQEGLYHQLVY